MKDWDYVWNYTSMVIQHLDIHKNKAGCCCLPPMACHYCPTHSMDLRYQDLSLSHWPVPAPVAKQQSRETK